MKPNSVMSLNTVVFILSKDTQQTFALKCIDLSTASQDCSSIFTSSYTSIYTAVYLVNPSPERVRFGFVHWAVLVLFTTFKTTSLSNTHLSQSSCYSLHTPVHSFNTGCFLFFSFFFFKGVDSGGEKAQ